MTDIYDQHRASFANVAAYVVLKDGERVATVAFKYPRDGAGRLYAYVHWIGSPMVRGFAAGGGYDKATAACSSAANRMSQFNPFNTDKAAADADAFAYAMIKDDGYGWDHNLRQAGFTVLQAV